MLKHSFAVGSIQMLGEPNSAAGVLQDSRQHRPAHVPGAGAQILAIEGLGGAGQKSKADLTGRTVLPHLHQFVSRNKSNLLSILYYERPAQIRFHPNCTSTQEIVSVWPRRVRWGSAAGSG
jgi:hypothetical protein